MENPGYHPQAAFPNDVDKPQVWMPPTVPPAHQPSPPPADFSQYNQSPPPPTFPHARRSHSAASLTLSPSPLPSVDWGGPIGAGPLTGAGQQVRMRQSPSVRSHPSGADPSYLPSTLLSNPLAQAAFNAYGVQMQQQMSGLFTFLNLHRLKYYFHVNNKYVLHKLYILLLPFLHRSWKRQHTDPNGQTPMDSLDPALYSQPSGVPRPPSEDVNAPDLYIPTMAFFTYIILMSYQYASSHATKTFDPELIGVLASSTLVLLILETAVIRLGLYLISAEQMPHLLDLVAFISYKFVHAIVILLLCVLTDSAMLFYSAILVLGGVHGLFMMRTMKRAMTPVIDAQTLQTQGAMKSNYFLLLVGGLQIIVVAFLVKGAV